MFSSRGDFVTGRSALCSHSFRGKLWLKDILLDPRARKKSIVAVAVVTCSLPLAHFYDFYLGLRAVDTMQDALDRAG